MGDLTNSKIDRQNILNNRLAVERIQTELGFSGLMFDGEYRFTKQMIADFYEVEERTIERYLEKHSEELSSNGYILCKDNSLKDFKLRFAHDINVVSKTTQLGLFNFRSFLNMGMLLTENDRARQVRSLLLDIVISSINEKSRGHQKKYKQKGHQLSARRRCLR